MFMKRCGVPSSAQRFCLMPGYLPSRASNTSARFAAVSWTLWSPPVNLRRGGGIRIVIGMKPPERDEKTAPGSAMYRDASILGMVMRPDQVHRTHLRLSHGSRGPSLGIIRRHGKVRFLEFGKLRTYGSCILELITQH